MIISFMTLIELNTRLLSKPFNSPSPTLQCNIMIVFKHKLSEELGPTSAANTPVVRLESNNPRVGLVNLGNTCYMNSVLQALVMTKHFSRELLLSYPTTTAMSLNAGSSKTELVFTIQKLLAQLLHSRRPELTPREVLHVTRPPSFLPGHQQDSSEFLSHLMDTLHEHEMSVRKRQQLDLQQKSRKRPATARDVEVAVDSVNRQKMDEEADLLMDYEQDEVDGEKGATGGVSKNTLIQRSFGGLLDTTYQCLNCGETSTNRDTFRDVSLSFGMVSGTFARLTWIAFVCWHLLISHLSFQDKESKYYVQHLLDYYCLSEKLEGDNQYRCDKCAKLCDGLRSMSFVAPPRNLILTLKHFKYDQQFHTRAKLMHNVVLNEMVTLKIQQEEELQGSDGKVSPVACSSAPASSGGQGATSGGSGGAVGGGGAGESTRLAKYQLYAVVVHSGMSMDAGHYYTYASDEPDSWYMFNDSYVTRCAAADVHRLRAPNTPYILFYRLVETQQQQQQQKPQRRFQQQQQQQRFHEEEDAGESLPELEELPSYLKDFVVKDNFTYCQEMQKGSSSSAAGGGAKSKQAFNYRNNNDSDSDDPPPPTCGGNAIDSCNSYIC